MADKMRAQSFARFMRFVAVAPEVGLCWNWTGNLPNNYGHFHENGKAHLAHRWIYIFLHGPIAGGKVVRHSCDNPKCVNPTHLELGTHKDNTQDAFTRGRMPSRKGEAHNQAKLTDEDVRRFRRLAKNGVPKAQLFRDYSISQSQGYRILAGDRWGHVT